MLVLISPYWMTCSEEYVTETMIQAQDKTQVTLGGQISAELGAARAYGT
jgi:hypothetical protein